MKQRHRVEIKPTASQRQLLNQTFGCCRVVYNTLLAQAIQEYDQYRELKAKSVDSARPVVSGYNLANRLPAIRNNPETPWLKEVSAVALQQTCLNLGKAFTNFFKRGNKGYPKFKKYSSWQSFNITGLNNFRIRDNGLWIIKSKTPIKVFWDNRGIPTNPSSVTITRSPTGRYYASFVVEVAEQPTTGTGTIGIDLGLTSYATLSNCTKIDNPKYFRKYQKRLATAQRIFARKKKGSKNKTKAGYRVAKIYEKIRNCRNDFIHKTAKQLVDEFKVIGIENLTVKNMVKNHNLAKSIQDASWGKFKQVLLDKSNARTNNTIVMMDPLYPSTNVCSNTDKRYDEKLKLKDRHYLCPHCGEHHDRDINAAKNMFNRAQYTTDSNQFSKLLIAENHYL